jgi:hypothetical protein
MEGQFFEEVRTVVARVRQFLAADCVCARRPNFRTTSVALASGLAMSFIVGLNPAVAAPLKEVRFSEPFIISVTSISTSESTAGSSRRTALI